VDDGFVFIEPWGFDPSTISVAVLVTYGLNDVFVPRQHGEWIARTVPGATVVVTELGHMGDPDADLIEEMAWLTEGARPIDR
jgi:pimeloyl-ACP methyl ester carboxylesterase